MTWLLQVTTDLFVASSVFLQDPQGVIGPLTFAVKLYSSCQTIILHLKFIWRENNELRINSPATYIHGKALYYREGKKILLIVIKLNQLREGGRVG